MDLSTIDNTYSKKTCADLYQRIWEDHETDFPKRLEKHSTYEGFDGYLAKQNQTTIAFTYGYRSLSGQFYHDQLSKAVSKEDYIYWLTDCFEIVELGVLASYRNQGIGHLLLEKLIEDKPMNTAILTVSVENKAALRFYKSLGFEIIVPSFHPMNSTKAYTLLGKKLHNSNE